MKHELMSEMMVDFLVGNKLDKWNVEVITPVPPKAIKPNPKANPQVLPMLEKPYTRHPDCDRRIHELWYKQSRSVPHTRTVSRQTALHARGPQRSRITPQNSCESMLAEEAPTNTL